MNTENPILAGGIPDRQVTNVTGAGLGYGGGGTGSARAGESNLWDDEEDDSGWDNLNN
jgi:hypothetical protein